MELPSPDAALQGVDRALIDTLQQATVPTAEQLATAGRLRMRYATGPLRRQLDQLLLRWDISEEQLHQATRRYWQQHSSGADEELTYGSGADS